MRCATCGTENAPDSRFCGGCGARVGGPAPRVAPTQKITDDASFPAKPAPPARPAPVVGPPQPMPPSRHGGSPPAPVVVAGTPAVLSGAPTIMPSSLPVLPNTPRPPTSPVMSGAPAVLPHTPRPPTSPVVQPVAPITPPRVHAPPGVYQDGSSLPVVARRPWGLIAVVLVIDIGLAVAGSWLLSQGLHAAPAASAASAPRAGGSP